MSFIMYDFAMKKVNKLAHDAFIKYSKGVFTNRYMVQAKNGKSGWTIKTSNEYVNDIVHAGLMKCTGSVHVTGVIVATFDVSKEAGFPTKGIKQFMGIKQAVVDDSIEVSKILDLMQRQPRAFYALSFTFPGGSVKTKAKAPKSAKPATADKKEITPDFCTLKTTDQALVEQLLFGLPTGNVTTVTHTLQITAITLPAGVSNPMQLREQSVRSGTIIRKAVVDDKEIIGEFPFQA